jgi:hypothetical protein
MVRSEIRISVCAAEDVALGVRVAQDLEEDLKKAHF